MSSSFIWVLLVVGLVLLLCGGVARHRHHYPRFYIL
jgi:flagellar basal body-associated protein FliL